MSIESVESRTESRLELIHSGLVICCWMVAVCLGFVAVSTLFSPDHPTTSDHPYIMIANVPFLISGMHTS